MKAKKQKKRLGCFPTLLVLIIIVLGVGIIMINYPAGMIPDRSNAQADGKIAGDDMLYVLLAGSDQNQAVPGSSRADTIIVGAVDLASDKMFFLSIPRDTYVNIPGIGNDKINHAYAYGGMDLLQQTVEDMLNIPIDQYALIDFSGFEDIINALGGVDIDVDKRMYYQTYDDVIDIEAGWQTLDGAQALQYVRYRSDAMGDITRVARQQTLLKAIFSEFSENNGYLKLPRLIPEINDALETDLTLLDILRLAVFSLGIDGNNIDSQTLSGDFKTIDGISYWQLSDSALMEIVSTQF